MFTIIILIFYVFKLPEKKSDLIFTWQRNASVKLETEEFFLNNKKLLSPGLLTHDTISWLKTGFFCKPDLQNWTAIIRYCHDILTACSGLSTNGTIPVQGIWVQAVASTFWQLHSANILSGKRASNQFKEAS